MEYDMFSDLSGDEDNRVDYLLNFYDLESAMSLVELSRYNYLGDVLPRAESNPRVTLFSNGFVKLKRNPGLVPTRGSLTRDGYYTIAGKGVHRLIAEGADPEGMDDAGLRALSDGSRGVEVDHIDGDQRNNKATNLRWVTTNEHIKITNKSRTIRLYKKRRTERVELLTHLYQNATTRDERRILLDIITCVKREAANTLRTPATTSRPSLDQISDTSNKCDQCQKVYLSKTALLQHKKDVHSGMVWICDGCNKVFSNHRNRMRHQKSICTKTSIHKTIV